MEIVDYNNFSKDYKYHYEIFRKFESLLKPYGLSIKIRDTDHTYESLRWWVIGQKDEVNEEVKQLLKSLHKEIYSTCQDCGSTIDNQYDSTYPDSGCFPDNKLLCERCRCIGNGYSEYELIHRYILAVKNNEYYAVKSLGDVKIMFLKEDNTISYCRIKDIKVSMESNNTYTTDFCIRVKPRNNEIADSDGFISIRIKPIGYDMGLRDIHGERIYSSDTGFALLDKSIYTIDYYTLSPEQIREFKNVPLVVTGNLRTGKWTFENHYYPTFSELVSLIGEENARIFINETR